MSDSYHDPAEDRAFPIAPSAAQSGGDTGWLDTDAGREFLDAVAERLLAEHGDTLRKLSEDD